MPIEKNNNSKKSKKNRDTYIVNKYVNNKINYMYW